MHITLSMHEAIKTLSEHLGARLGEKVTVSIDDGQSQPSQIKLFIDKVRAIATSSAGSGGLINAIKYFRGVTGQGLVESKAIVEEIRAGEPSNATVANIVIAFPQLL